MFLYNNFSGIELQWQYLERPIVDHREAQFDENDQVRDQVGEAGVPVGSGKSAFRIIQITKHDDLVRLLPLGREFHDESRYAHVPFSETKFIKAYERIIAKPKTTLGVYVEWEDAIVGAMS